jgi:serine/threonine protein kinase
MSLLSRPTADGSVAYSVYASGADAYAPGDYIDDKYLLEERIGDGGMGIIWRAKNVLLESPVAIKLICRQARQEGASERLLIEAKAAGCLRHPAVVKVFDFGITAQDDPFIAMELLSGESLRDRLDREGSLDAKAAVRTLLPILGGLGCAHSRGIVHRDLKPENVFLASDDAGRIQPKVVDFGIAKMERAAHRLTSVGVLVGSPGYMSPEQALGEEDVDARSDLWAFAVVLYESILGRPPWDAANCPALLRAIVDDAPGSLVGFGGVDGELWAILAKGLAKDRKSRWSSSREFGRALSRWLSRQSVTDDITGASLQSGWFHEEPAPPRPRRRVSGKYVWPAVLAAAAAFFLWVHAQRGGVETARLPARGAEAGMTAQFSRVAAADTGGDPVALPLPPLEPHPSAPASSGRRARTLPAIRDARLRPPPRPAAPPVADTPSLGRPRWNARSMDFGF